MFFPADAFLAVTRLGWHLKPFGPIPDQAKELIQVQDPVYEPQALHTYLRSMPNAEEQEKILHTLAEAAREHGAATSNLRWWDISPGEHWLFADIRRNDVLVLVSFCWKTVKKGLVEMPLGQAAEVCWVFDKHTPRRARFLISQPEYHSLIAAYRKWLSEPLPPLPAWAV